MVKDKGKDIAKPVIQWLKLYNLLLFTGWAAVLLLGLIHCFDIQKPTFYFMAALQIAAIFEVAHAALGWVRSPLMTTALQIASRIFIVILLFILPWDKLIGQGIFNGLSLILIAWPLTETIRYAWYFLNLSQIKAGFLEYLRYTLFIILYPIGVSGELLIIFSVIKWQGFGSLYGILLLLSVPAYIIFFPKLYAYMWKQRQKKLVHS